MIPFAILVNLIPSSTWLMCFLNEIPRWQTTLFLYHTVNHCSIIGIERSYRFIVSEKSDWHGAKSTEPIIYTGNNWTKLPSFDIVRKSRLT